MLLLIGLAAAAAYPGLVQVRLPMSSSTGAAKGFAFVVGYGF